MQGYIIYEPLCKCRGRLESVLPSGYAALLPRWMFKITALGASPVALKTNHHRLRQRRHPTSIITAGSY